MVLELNYLNYMSEFLHKKPELEYKHKLLLEKSEAEYWGHREKEDAKIIENKEESKIYEGFWCMDYYCPEYEMFRAPYVRLCHCLAV